MKKFLLVLSFLMALTFSASAQTLAIQRAHNNLSSPTYAASGYMVHSALYYTNGVPFAPTGGTGGVVSPAAWDAYDIRVVSAYVDFNDGLTKYAFHKVTYVGPSQINFVGVFSPNQSSNAPVTDGLFAGNSNHTYFVQKRTSGVWNNTHFINSSVNIIIPAVKINSSTGLAQADLYDYLGNYIKTLDGNPSPRTSGGQPTILVFYLDGINATFDDPNSCAKIPRIDYGSGFTYTNIASTNLQGNRIYDSGYYGVGQANVVVPSTIDATKRFVFQASPVSFGTSHNCYSNGNVGTFDVNVATGPWY